MIAEWLEADGLGGFSSGTVGGARTRRYHALLLCATTPPTGRFVLVNGMEVWAEKPAGSFALSAQHYLPDVRHPDGHSRVTSFSTEPWPNWTFRLEDGTQIEQALCVPRGEPSVIVTWRLVEHRDGVVLSVRPLLSGRDYHSLHHENSAFRFDAAIDGQCATWRPYDGGPSSQERGDARRLGRADST